MVADFADELFAKLCRDEPFPSLEGKDVHTLAGVVKFFLRHTEESLITEHVYDNLIKLLDLKDEKAQVQLLKAVIDILPSENKAIFTKIIQFLCLVALFENQTMMNAHNLAIVVGPSIIRPTGKSFDEMMHDSKYIISIIELVIKRAQSLFKPLANTIEISQPVSLRPEEVEVLLERDRKEKEKELRDPLKKLESLKKTHVDLQNSYDELRQQYSVLESYAALQELKVSQLEEALELFETADSSPRYEFWGNNQNELHLLVKELKAENEKLHLENTKLKEFPLQLPLHNDQILEPHGSPNQGRITPPLKKSGGKRVVRKIKTISGRSVLTESNNEKGNENFESKETKSPRSGREGITKSSRCVTLPRLIDRSPEKILNDDSPENSPIYPNLIPVDSFDATGNLNKTIASLISKVAQMEADSANKEKQFKKVNLEFSYQAAELNRLRKDVDVLSKSVALLGNKVL